MTKRKILIWSFSANGANFDKKNVRLLRGSFYKELTSYKIHTLVETVNLGLKQFGARALVELTRLKCKLKGKRYRWNPPGHSCYHLLFIYEGDRPVFFT